MVDAHTFISLEDKLSYEDSVIVFNADLWSVLYLYACRDS